MTTLKAIIIIVLVSGVGISGIIDAADASGTNVQNRASATEQSQAGDYISRGNHYFQNRDWQMAIDNFDKAILLQPTNASFYEYRGLAYFLDGQFENAISDYSTQIRLDPTNETPYLNRGTVYRARNEWDKAIADFNECLRLNTNNAAAYKDRAAVHDAKGQYGQAITDWNRSLRLSPKDDIAFSGRGFAYFMTGQFDKALEDYHHAIQINPKNGFAYNGLAWLRSTCPVASFRNGEEAVKAATKACELSNWQMASWIDTLAAANAEVGNFAQAIKYEKRAIAMSGSSERDLSTMNRSLSLYERHEPNHEGQKQ